MSCCGGGKNKSKPGSIPGTALIIGEIVGDETPVRFLTIVEDGIIPTHVVGQQVYARGTIVEAAIVSGALILIPTSGNPVDPTGPRYCVGEDVDAMCYQSLSLAQHQADQQGTIVVVKE